MNIWDQIEAREKALTEARETQRAITKALVQIVTDMGQAAPGESPAKDIATMLVALLGAIEARLTLLENRPGL